MNAIQPAGLVLAGLSLLFHGASSAQDPLEIGHEERASLHVVLDWPFTVAANKPLDEPSCSSLGAADLEITEDGHAVEVARVGAARGSATHLVVIDTSRSMSAQSGILHRRLGQTRLAARHYVDLISGELAVHEGDRLGIITFDDDLVMRWPPVRIADSGRLDELRDAIASIGGGYGTAFLDGLYRVVDAVDGLDERFVLVLISDGDDTASVLGETDLRRLIARANNVTIFAIGIELKHGPHRSLISFMAEDTGGHYYDVGDSENEATLAARLRRSFTDIHERLTHQYYATYVTRNSSRPEAGGDPFVDVRIRAPGRECRVSGYKRQRYLPSQTPSPLEAGVHWVLTEDRPVSGPAVIRVGIRDFARDSGPLAVWGGEPPAEPSRVHLTVDRTVELLVPALDCPPAAGNHEAVDLVDAWIETQLPVGTPSVPPASHLGPRTINGKAFLHNRDLLARAVFESLPAYRDWFRAKLEPELRARYRAALPADHGDEEIELLAQARLQQPRSEDLEDRLAAWLGDLGTLDLAFALERKWANAWARGAAAGGPDLEHVRARWATLFDWLRPPDLVRVFVPLVLSYDADRDAFGFYRIVLPRLRQLPDSEVPPLPLGLEMFALLSSGIDGPATPGCYRIESVEHHALQRDELPPVAFPRRVLRDREIRRLRLRLGGESCPDIEMDLAVEIVEGAATPFCALTIDSEDPQAVERLLGGRTIPRCRALAG